MDSLSEISVNSLQGSKGSKVLTCTVHSIWEAQERAAHHHLHVPGVGTLPLLSVQVVHVDTLLPCTA